MVVLPEVYRRALFRKDAPYFQGVRLDYLNPEEKDAAERIAPWLLNAR